MLYADERDVVHVVHVEHQSAAAVEDAVLLVVEGALLVGRVGGAGEQQDRGAGQGQASANCGGSCDRDHVSSWSKRPARRIARLTCSCLTCHRAATRSGLPSRAPAARAARQPRAINAVRHISPASNHRVANVPTVPAGPHRGKPSADATWIPGTRRVSREGAPGSSASRRARPCERMRSLRWIRGNADVAELIGQTGTSGTGRPSRRPCPQRLLWLPHRGLSVSFQDPGILADRGHGGPPKSGE